MNIAIFLFEKSCNMAQPWAEAGYLCYCVDIQHPKGETREGNIIKVGADIQHWIPPRGDILFMAAFPPCTDLSVSGARWFKHKGLRALENAISLFARTVEIAETMDCPWMAENPVSTISTYWRKPDHTFHPYQYTGYCLEDNYTKKTCLWTGGASLCLNPSSSKTLKNPTTEFTKHHLEKAEQTLEVKHQKDLQWRYLKPTGITGSA